MLFTKVNEDTYLLRLEKGEEVLETLKKFLEKEKIMNGTVTGIGSMEDPTLAHYRVDNRKYSEKNLKGIFEVTSLLGNIAIFESQPLIHIHVNISDESMNALGGHLVRGVVSATLELQLTKFSSENKKKFNEKIGLRLWEFENILD